MTETKMKLVDWLDDLCVRFIVNLPKEELESVERICFQVEEAQWFYEDFIRPLDPSLPSLNLRQFCLRIFQHCPLLSGFSPYHHSTAFSEFLAYKTRVPVRGAIMLNEAMDECVLVKGWKKSANWSFPRGKINKDEKDIDCAVREVYEETGYDIMAAGLVGDEQNSKYIEVTMREQHMRLYVFRGVPMDTYFEPRTRKEISKISWYKLSELPTLKKMKQQQQEGRGEDPIVNANKFYMVAPFLVPLKKWITQQKKLDAVNGPKHIQYTSASNLDTFLGEEAQNKDSSNDSLAGTDVSRLLTQLRQSGQASRESSLPEVFAPTETLRSASTELKTVFSVHEKATVNANSVDIREKPRDKASAMLSLLRSGYGNQSNRLLESFQQQQTSLDQIMGQPLMPPSPKTHPTRTPHGTTVPPPVFPYSPAQIGSQVYSQSSQPISNSGSFNQIHTQSDHPIIHNQSQASQQPLLSPFPVRGPQMTAPYQRTGDPLFLQSQNLNNRLPSAMPLASNSRPPKLSAHSSALLNLFKNGPPEQMPPMPSFNVTQPVSKGVESRAQKLMPASLLPNTKKHSVYATGVANMSAVRPALASPSLVVAQQNGAPKLQSEQQSALLDLFRSSSASNATVERPVPALQALQIASAPVELSAHPSPAHARSSSQALKSGVPRTKPSSSAKPLVNGQVTIQKRPSIASGPKKAPVSATVTGPLHVPQFEKILKKPSEHHGASSTHTRNTSGNSSATTQQHAVPKKILSRHSTVAVYEEDQAGTVRLPKRSSQDRVKGPSHQQSLHAELQQSPRPFQPQILRRPVETELPAHVETQSLSEEPRVPQMMSPTPATPSPLTNARPMMDRRGIQTEEHKLALLSLFSGQKQPSFASTSIHDTLVSPLSERPVTVGNDIVKSTTGTSIVGGSLNTSRADSMVSMLDDDLSSFRMGTTVSRLGDDLTKSRMGSMVSMLGDDLPRSYDLPKSRLDGDNERRSRLASAISVLSDDEMERGHQTSKATPIDKQFLLGFLDGVAKGARK